mgnify:CR=1 FL=1
MPAKKKKKGDKNVAQEPQVPYGSEALSFEKVWLMFQETDRFLTDKFAETDRQFKESDRFLTEKFVETDKQFKETDRRLKNLNELFTSHWGKLMEALITPSCLKLFKDRGIDIKRTYSNVEIESEELSGEFDIVLANGTQVVIVEVKTTFRAVFVDEFLEKMQRIREFLPEHANKTIYGAIAAIKYDENSDRYAYRKGLFVIKNSGEGLLKIANSKKFEPVEF